VVDIKVRDSCGKPQEVTPWIRRAYDSFFVNRIPSVLSLSQTITGVHISTDFLCARYISAVMQLALSIFELASAVVDAVGFDDKPTSACLGRTSRAFHEPATNALWQYA
jgi:hypothetical protein